MPLWVSWHRLDSASQRLVTQRPVSRPGPGLRVGLRPERPGGSQEQEALHGDASPPMGGQGREEGGAGWANVGSALSLGGSVEGLGRPPSHHLQGHFRLLGSEDASPRQKGSLYREGEPPEQKEAPLSAAVPWALLRSPALSIPALRAPHPACSALASLHCARSPRPPACLLPHSLRHPPPLGASGQPRTWGRAGQGAR